MAYVDTTGTGGNPNLKPVRAATYDLGTEWYYAPKAAVTGALFYTDFSSIVDLETTTGNYLNLSLTGNNLSKPIYSNYTLTVPYNTTSTSRRGAEGGGEKVPQVARILIWRAVMPNSLQRVATSCAANMAA